MTALVILLLVGIAVYAATRNRRSRPQPHATPLVERVAFLERRVAELQAALDALRGTVPAPKPEPTPAAAAVGAGIAGAYVTLRAAVSLYDLISKPVALVAAGGIAAVGLTVSLAWSEEIVAGFGLIGAMLVPATLVFQGGLQQIGTAFVAIVFAAAGVVAVRARWWTMLQVA